MKKFLIGTIIFSMIATTMFGQTVVYDKGSKVTVEGMTDEIFDSSSYAGLCLKGDKNMCGEFAMDYMYGGLQISNKDALVILTKGCKLRDAAACQALNVLKNKGKK